MSNLREAKQAGQSKLISHLRQGHIKKPSFCSSDPDKHKPK